MRALIAAMLALSLTGCGGVFFQANSNPDNHVVTVSGFVTVIQFTTISGAGNTSIFVTVITLEQSSSGFSTLNFCGDVRSQFSAGAFATMKFTQSADCVNLIAITFG